MAIKVNIPSGQNTATVSGLYQWDYGQVLEIESADLGNMIGEVHFACSSMSEAVVVSCNFTEGLGSVTIPDECLEQSSNITAWIYEISGTQGRTRKVITIYVTARTRPSVGQDIPTEISNRYTELITEVNKAVDKLENGDVVVKKATEATRATSATSAGNASTANYAVNAGSASYAEDAGTAKYATNAGSADNATNADNATAANKASLLDVDPLVTNASGIDTYSINSTGIYAVVFKNDSISLGSSLIAVTDLKKDIYTPDYSPWQLIYDASLKALGVFVDSGNTIPIIAVYKIADI